MALKVWVALTAPAAMAARVSACGGIRVAQRDANARASGVGGQLDGARQFGRQRHQAHLALGGFEETVEDGDVGREQVLGRLHAALGMGEKRAFEMNSDGPGSLVVGSRSGFRISTARARRRRGALRRAER